MRQIGLQPAGCQLWNSSCAAAGTEHFAYCSTLAIYVYRLDTFQLVSVIAGFEKTITALCWSLHDSRIIATTSGEKEIRVWDIENSNVIASIDCGKYLPKVLEWNPHDPHSLAVVTKAGHVLVYDYNRGSTAMHDYSGSSLKAVVFRWHQNRSQVGCWAVGTFDGFIIVGSLGDSRLGRYQLGSLGKLEIHEMQWDPLSEAYLLVSNVQGVVVLFDVASGSEMTLFDRAAGGLTALGFIPGEPGNFVTAGEKTGILRLWNVSQKSPKGSCRPSKSGFQNMSFAPGEAGQNGAATVCSFRDGSVGVYDLRKKQWDFLSEEAHTETIFDCVFKPNDANQLATVSYDGTIKLWDLQTMQTIGSVACDEVLYCASWAPGNDDRILACSSDGKIFILECTPGRGKVLFCLQAHRVGEPSFRCSWSQVDADYVISTSRDRDAVVVCVSTGAVAQRYQHPAAVFGCDWHRVDAKRFVTGCQDGIVRVFDRTQSAPVMALRGHSAKVFNTVWSKLQPHMLASGSDDCSVRVWDTKTQTSTALTGHTMNVRALIWHSEVPWMVITGSWDATIRVWDVRSSTCLRVVADHHADVYGLGSHPDRPFLFVSSSRDNTIRQWRLDDMVSHMIAEVLVVTSPSDGIKGAFGSLLGSVADAMAPNATMMLAGHASRELAHRLDRCPTDVAARQLVSSFLQSPPDLAEVWNLAQTILTGKTASVQNRIVHANDILRSVQARAQELEGARVARFAGVGGARKEDQLEAAAKMYLRLGMIQQHCEILIELGEWQRALSVAPGAGMEYWKSLSERYIDRLEESKQFEEAVPYLAATANVDRLMESVVAHGKLEDAFVVAKAAREGRFRALVSDTSPASTGLDDTAQVRLHNVSRLLAQRHSTLGHPILAAACYLAMDDTRMAVRALFMGNELVLACTLANVLQISNAEIDPVYEALALSLEGAGHWELAVKVLRKQQPQVAQRSVKLCAARYPDNVPPGNLTTEQFYERAGLLPPADQLAMAGSAHDTVEEICCFLVGREFKRAVSMGIAELRRLLSTANWSVDAAENISRPLQSANFNPEDTSGNLLSACVFYAAFVGSASACARGMVSVAGHLVRHAESVAQRQSLQDFLPAELTCEAIAALVAAYMEGDSCLVQYRSNALGATASCDGCRLKSLTSFAAAPSQAKQEKLLLAIARLRICVSAIPAMYNAPALNMLSNIETEIAAGPPGSNTAASYYCWSEVTPLACAIPAGRAANESMRSAISNKPLRGAAYRIGPGVYAGFAECVMWSRVNLLSPVADGSRLSPV